MGSEYSNDADDKIKQEKGRRGGAPYVLIAEEDETVRHYYGS
jgi:hypothetical protein